MNERRKRAREIKRLTGKLLGWEFREQAKLGLASSLRLRREEQQLSSTYFNSPILPNRGERATSRRRYNSPLCRRQCSVMSANALKGPPGECVQKAIVPPVKQVYESFF